MEPTLLVYPIEVGFFTAYPMNYILVKTGLKEAMA